MVVGETRLGKPLLLEAPMRCVLLDLEGSSFQFLRTPLLQAGTLGRMSLRLEAQMGALQNERLQEPLLLDV